MKYIVTFVLLLSHVNSFAPIVSIPKRHIISIASRKGKGFGPPKPSRPDKKKEQPKEQLEEQPKDDPNDVILPSRFESKPVGFREESPLQEMRRKQVEKKDAKLRKMKVVREMDEAVAEEAPAIPEKVAMRMGQRMIPFVGIPLFLASGSFVVFWYLATYKDIEFQPVSVAATTIGLLVISLIGITYSIFSTPWDEDRDGSTLGFDEAARNLENVKAGLVRTSEVAEIRDRMARMPEEEIQKQLSDLDHRDAKRRQEMD